MKFASVVFALIGVGGIATVDGMSIRGRGANKLMTFARRLDEDAAEENGDENNNNGENGEENGDDSMYFLKDYSIKLLSCIQGEQVSTTRTVKWKLARSFSVFVLRILVMRILHLVVRVVMVTMLLVSPHSSKPT